ncbi:exported hypothetical protein [uncultured Dysgonomonas sp.]|uniref:Uncharacterized protein n=1 Tax=uncultured Dysgonomonas sp. TaxID=206096 RepID=A0A212JSZ1_9BACT|nr:exported hypothetical protein [uncultured Dysgonomonas sp.]
MTLFVALYASFLAANLLGSSETKDKPIPTFKKLLLFISLIYDSSGAFIFRKIMFVNVLTND